MRPWTASCPSAHGRCCPSRQRSSLCRMPSKMSGQLYAQHSHWSAVCPEHCWSLHCHHCMHCQYNMHKQHIVSRSDIGRPTLQHLGLSSHLQTPKRKLDWHSNVVLSIEIQRQHAMTEVTISASDLEKVSCGLHTWLSVRAC